LLFSVALHLQFAIDARHLQQVIANSCEKITGVTDSINTQHGLAELATLIRRARGTKKLREFAREVGVDPMTIHKIEERITQNPSDKTLAALASAVGVSLWELKTIASSNQFDQTKSRTKAKNQLNVLPDKEAAALIVERLQRMPDNELASILRAIADRIQGNRLSP
jgi:transcriptional regulator with XRE-family HTH domain